MRPPGKHTQLMHICSIARIYIYTSYPILCATKPSRFPANIYARNYVVLQGERLGLHILTLSAYAIMRPQGYLY